LVSHSIDQLIDLLADRTQVTIKLLA